jgi:hypothetical protein
MCIKFLGINKRRNHKTYHRKEKEIQFTTEGTESTEKKDRDIKEIFTAEHAKYAERRVKQRERQFTTESTERRFF